MAIFFLNVCVFWEEGIGVVLVSLLFFMFAFGRNGSVCLFVLKGSHLACLRT